MEHVGFMYVKTTKLVQASTIACSSSAILEQHGSTCSSRLAQHVKRVESCWNVTWRAKWNLGLTRAIYPSGMTGWVGLVRWLIADVFTHSVVTPPAISLAQVTERLPVESNKFNHFVMPLTTR